MKFLRHTIHLLIFSVISFVVNAQQPAAMHVSTDSFTNKKNPLFSKDTGLVISQNGDTVKIIPRHNPRIATLRSLAVPGWGQAYNNRYWEIPIVYGALGITGAIYLYNNKWYRRTRDAYDIRVNRNNTADTALIHPRLIPLSANSLQVYRNAFRRDRDYSALYFLVFWALNVVDAAVFAHLKDFDVSEDLSLRVNPVFNQGGGKGIGLALGFRNTEPKYHRFVMP